MDFFSWHSYDNIDNNILYANYACKCLDAAGYSHTETTCNEWNYDAWSRGTNKHAAFTAGMLLAFQNTPLDSTMFYDARVGTSVYGGGVFNPLTQEPFPTYFAFTAFNELYQLGKQVDVLFNQKGVYAVGARNEDRGCVVIVNTTGEKLPYCIRANGMVEGYSLYHDGGNISGNALPTVLDKESILVIRFELPTLDSKM